MRFKIIRFLTYLLANAMLCSQLVGQAFRPVSQKSAERPPRMLWSDGKLYLSADDLPSGRKGWAILRSNSTSRLWLGAKPRLIAPLAGSLDTQIVLVPIDDISELDQYAPLVHESSASCGALEFLPRGYSLQSSIDYHPAIYSSWVQFPELPQLLDAIDVNEILGTVEKLSQVESRFHRHPKGLSVSALVQQDWQSALAPGDSTQIQDFLHSDSPQRSVIARLEGTRFPQETVILGAHLDSISNRLGGTLNGLSPGADDNASGVAILKEILRLVSQRGLKFQRSVEWQAYAAEEVGLVGSREIAKLYRQQLKSVAGMLQFDMAAYTKDPLDDGLLYFLEDYTSRDFRRQATDWVLRYRGPFVRFGKLPNGSASDHKAWWEQGYRTLFAFENPEAYNPFIHSPEDTLTHFDSGLRLRRMAELGLLFLAHQAGLENLDRSYQEQLSTAIPRDLPTDLQLAFNLAADGQHYLAVSAPEAAASLEFCQVESPTDLICKKERETLSESVRAGERTIFYSRQAWSWREGESWRLLAYDKDQKLLAWRQIQLGSSP